MTGAFAGFGLATAQRLVERGARHLVLLGRNPPGAEAAIQLATWRAAGVEVLTLQLDVADRTAMAQAFARIDATGRVLRGVVHSAGALADGALLQQDWRQFEVPLRAKVAGAWILHEETRERRLDFFILYSSIAGTFGSAGQANHAAANAFMDALAERRRALGLPALSIAWGAWSEIGAAAARGVDEKAAWQGVRALTPAQGLDALETLAAGAPAHVVASPMDWRTYLLDWKAQRRNSLTKSRMKGGRCGPLDRRPGTKRDSQMMSLSAACRPRLTQRVATCCRTSSRMR